MYVFEHTQRVSEEIEELRNQMMNTISKYFPASGIPEEIKSLTISRSDYYNIKKNMITIKALYRELRGHYSLTPDKIENIFYLGPYGEIKIKKEGK